MDKFSIIKAAVDRADPCGLLETGAPSDEYGFEAAEIAAAVVVGDTKEKIAEAAAEVFSKAFSCEVCADRFLGFAEEVWRELQI